MSILLSCCLASGCFLQKHRTQILLRRFQPAYSHKYQNLPIKKQNLTCRLWDDWNIYILTAPSHPSVQQEVCYDCVRTITCILFEAKTKYGQVLRSFLFSPRRKWQATHKVVKEVKLSICFQGSKTCFVQIEAVAASLPKHMTNFALPVFARPQLSSEIFHVLII